MLLGVSQKLCCDFLMLSVVVDLDGLTLLEVNPVFDPSPESVQFTNWKSSLVFSVITLQEFSPQKSYTSQLQPSFFVTFITHEW